MKLVVVACNTAAAAGLGDAAAAPARPGGRGDRTRGAVRCPMATRNRQGGGDRYGGDHLVGRLPAGHRRSARPPRAQLRRLPGFRGVRRTGRHPLGSGGRAGRAVAGTRCATPVSTPCCSAAPTIPSWPGPSPTPWGAAWCSCRRPTRRRSTCGPPWPRALATGTGGPGEARFFSSGDVDWFRPVGGRLFGAELGDVGKVSWPGPSRWPRRSRRGRSRP